MDNYFYKDDQMLALDGTLVHFVCTGQEVTVPAMAGRQPLRVLGSGAINGSYDKQCITLSEGFEELHSDCFSVAGRPQQITIPASVKQIAPHLFIGNVGEQTEIHLRRIIPTHRLSMLEQASFRVSGGERLFSLPLAPVSELEMAGRLLQQTGTPFAQLLPEMLFFFHPDPKWDNKQLFEPRSCLNTAGFQPSLTEHAAVKHMIQKGVTGWQHPEAEHQWDLRARAGQVFFQLKPCPFLTWRPSDNVPAGPGLTRVTLVIRLARCFVPSLHPIRWGRKDWWLYSRNALTENPAIPYYREDVGIFDINGLVTDRQLSEEVYAKYRLPSLL